MASRVSAVSMIRPSLSETRVPNRCWSDELARGQPQPRRQHAVGGGWRSSPLEMTQNDAPRLDTGLTFDGLGDHAGDPTQAEIAERVGGRSRAERLTVGKAGAFGDDHEAELLAGLRGAG